jgi:pilus assembly protein CpaF
MTIEEAPVDGVAILETEVRELIRRRGIDPIRDRPGVVSLVTDVIADYDGRSVVGAVPPLVDAVAAHKAVVDAVAGLGPLQKYLDDPEVEEIWINAPTQVFVARRGESELTTTILTDSQVRDLVEKMLKVSGRRLDLSSPFVDASLPGGERLHAVIPDVTRQHWSVNIRKYVVRASTLDDLVGLGTLTPHAAAFLHGAVRAGLNVLVSGGTQAGKTTMLNSLAGAIPARERVITCEEVFELRLVARDWVAMQCRQPSLEGTGEIPLRRLVKEALRMRPSRLLVGEVREAEALDLLIALNAGVPAMCTIHANSAREALTKLCTLPLLAGENVSDRFVIPTVASAVDLVVHLDLDGTGRRLVREIVAVPGRVEQGIVETADIFHTRDGHLVRADGYPPHPERFARTGTDLAALLRGRG